MTTETQHTSPLPDGIETYFALFQPQKDNGYFPDIDYSDDELHFYTHTITNIDTQLSTATWSTNPNPEIPLVSLAADENETLATVKDHQETILQLLESDDYTVCLGLLTGILPALQGLFEAAPPELQEKISSAIVSRTALNKTETPAIITEIDPQILYPDNDLIVFDDIADTVVTLAVIALERGNLNNPDLIQQLDATFGHDFSQFTHLYEQLTDLMIEQNVIAAIMFYKNEPFYNVLRQQVVKSILSGSRSKRLWAKKQRAFLDLPPLSFPQNKWLMGCGVDTMLKGEDLLPHLTDLGISDEQISDIAPNFEQTNFRIGSTIQELIALEPNQPEDTLETWVASQFALQFNQA